MASRHSFAQRFSALLGPGSTGVRESFAALTVGLAASLIAGLSLGAISDTLLELPGLLVLVPAAIGLRGAIFGALGSRLGTASHAGTFHLSRRADTVLGQNVAASVVLTLASSVVLALMAKVVAVGFGLDGTISVVDYLVISIIGGLLASLVVLVSTVALTEVAVRREWDPDNVLAPLITAFGDLVTLPALYVATFVVGGGLRGPTTAVLGSALALVALVATFRSGDSLTRRIVVESGPFVLLAGGVSLVAGLVLEGQLDSLTRFPALLVLVPPFLATAGSLGGILSNRLTTKLHLGVIPPAARPGREARSDIGRVFLLAVPLFAAVSLVGDLSSVAFDLSSPGALRLAGVTVVGGLLTTGFASVVAYWTAVLSYRAGLDPDNVGIPMVTSSIDLVGSLSFVLAVAAVAVP